MAKSLILANGNIFVGLNQHGFVSDFFYPYVGVENHVRGSVHKIGVWVNGYLTWIDDGEWSIDANLAQDTFVGVVKCFHKHSNIEVIFHNFVCNEKNIFMRQVEIINHTHDVKDIKIFFHQVFCIYGTSQEDTAYYDPTKNAIIHYEGRRVFFVYAESSDIPFNDYSVGLYGIEGKEGVYKDAEDGMLAKNPIEHGRIDSILSVPLTLHKEEKKVVNYWITVGETKGEAEEIHRYILHKTPKHLLETTSKFWKAWLLKHDLKPLPYLNEKALDLFKKSLFYIRANVDNRGAVLASGDSDMLQRGRDTYSYMWPRDGAMTVMSLLKIGEENISKRFFKFCSDVLEPDGYLMHKYRSDKSIGSSWHSFVKDGEPILPIQEDETALVLIALWDYYVATKDIEFIDSHYYGFIKKMSLFLVDFINKDTGLPLPSYDLWEEKHGVSTFTCSTVYAGLLAGAHFAELFEKNNTKDLLRQTAERLQRAIIENLYDESMGMFLKQISYKHGQIIKDTTIDMSSVYGIFTYGVLPVDDEKVTTSIKTIESELRINRGIDGVPRYTRDKYYLQVDDVPNPWYITTLWLAQYYILKAKTKDDLGEAQFWINWVLDRAPSSGVLGEQLHPFTGEQLSATPLTWSHAEYVRTIMLYQDQITKLGL